MNFKPGKTELLKIGACSNAKVLNNENKEITEVTEYKYLGSMVPSVVADFERRRNLAWVAQEIQTSLEVLHEEKAQDPYLPGDGPEHLFVRN